MKMEYTILDTESTRDFAEGLIGMTFKATGFTKVAHGVNYITNNNNALNKLINVI